MTYKLKFLGTGSSGGVPRIGHHWSSADRTNPKNRRRRCSVTVQRVGPKGTTTVLIDTSPDLREQCLAHDVMSVDGVLFTHDHHIPAATIALNEKGKPVATPYGIEL